MSYLYLLIPAAVIFLAGIRNVKPTQRGLIMRFGNFQNFAHSGFHWIIPIIDRLYVVDVTEQIVNTERQELLTYDKFYTSVNAQVNFKVKTDEESLKGFIYNVSNYEKHIIKLARTTLHNIVGTITFNSVDIEPGNINAELYKTLYDETKNWGIEIVATKMNIFDPSQDL